MISHLSCHEVAARLDDFVDRELTPDEMALVRSHLDACALCAREHQFEAEVLDAIRGRLQRIAVPPDLVARILASLGQCPPTP